MVKTKLIALILAINCNLFSFAQEIRPEKLDSTISLLWNSTLKTQIQIFNPTEEDYEKKNSLLTLYKVDQGNKKIIYVDTFFAYTLKYILKDFNGDGIDDLLVFYLKDGSSNSSYHLYLIDQKNGLLKKVKGFEKLYNPIYDQKGCFIWGQQLLGNKIVLRNFIIDKNGNLRLVYI